MRCSVITASNGGHNEISQLLLTGIVTWEISEREYSKTESFWYRNLGNSIGMCRSKVTKRWYVIYVDRITGEVYKIYHNHYWGLDNVFGCDVDPEMARYPHMRKREYADPCDFRIENYKAYWEDYPLRCVSRFVVFQDKYTGELYKVSPEGKSLYL